MEVDDAMVELEFDAVHAWKPRNCVIITRMEDYLARRRVNVLVEVEEVETYLLCPADVEGIIDILGWKATDHAGRRRFAARKTRGGNQVANVRQYAMLRGRRDAEYQLLYETIEYMNEKQGGLLATMERKQKLKVDEWSPGLISGEALSGDQGLGQQDLGGGSGVAGEERNEGHVEGKEADQSGSVERYRCCGEVSKLQTASLRLRLAGRHGRGPEIRWLC